VYLGDGSGQYTFDNFNDALPHGFSFTAADFNNDGFLDVAMDSQDDELTVHQGLGDGTFSSMVQYTVGINWWSGAMEAGDFNEDGVPDLAVADNGGLGLTLLSPDILPKPMRQRLSDLPLQTIPVPQDTNPVFIASVTQTAQDVASLGISITVEFAQAPTGQIEASLTAPDGTTIVLGNTSTYSPWPPAPATATAWRWSAPFPTTPGSADLSPMEIMQPRGEWILELQNETDQVGELTEFAVLTTGRLVGPSVGDRADHPKRITWSTSELGLAITHGSTHEHVNKRNLVCAATGTAPDSYHEFSIGATRDVIIDVVGDFNVAVELRQGACDSSPTYVACDNNSGAGLSASLSASSLGANTYCIIVDGVAGGAGIYQMYLELDCITGQHNGGDDVCVATGTCSTGYALDGGGDCTLCDTGYHDDGIGNCVPLGTCATGYSDGGDGSCVPDGTCAAGYHDGGEGACVVAGTCSTGYAVDLGGDCTLCDTGYHDGGDGRCVLAGTCSTGYHDGGDGSCLIDGQCADGYGDDGTGVCVLGGVCAANYHDGGFGRCIADSSCEYSHTGALCDSCVSGYTANGSGQCLLTGLTCPADDAFEPNDDFSTMTLLNPGDVVEGIYCDSNLDIFTIDITPTCALDVDVIFSHAEGNIELIVVDFAGEGDPEYWSQSTTDNESLRVYPVDQNLLIAVFNPSGIPEEPAYTLLVEEYCP
jgi:hypothetical protein